MTGLSAPPSSIAAVEIALDLDREAVSKALGIAFDRFGEPRIALVQCFALSRHLQNIVGAIGRTILRRSLVCVRIASSALPAGRVPTVGSGYVVAHPASELVRLQARLIAAIGPGIVSDVSLMLAERRSIAAVVGETSIAPITNFLPNGALPTFMPYVSVDDLKPIPLHTSGLSMYELGSGAHPRTLLWRWTKS